MMKLTNLPVGLRYPKTDFFLHRTDLMANCV